jgi:UDP-2-acetamido-3-amino-2,3-dideoxy-glucuronate N-acetyltransferase
MTDAATAGPDAEVHPTAVIHHTAIIASGARIGAYSSLGANSRVGPASQLDDHVVVENGVQIGSGSWISAGTVMQPGVVIGNNVVIGPNVAFVAAGFNPSSESVIPKPTVVRDGASIGANASLLAGVTIGPRSVVGAGTVVTRDVPAYATVVGSPAKIIGYEASPRFTASRRIRASSLEDAAFPMSIGLASLTRLPLVEDLRGSSRCSTCPAGRFGASTPTEHSTSC